MGKTGFSRGDTADAGISNRKAMSRMQFSFPPREELPHQAQIGAEQDAPDALPEWQSTISSSEGRIQLQGQPRVAHTRRRRKGRGLARTRKRISMGKCSEGRSPSPRLSKPLPAGTTSLENGAPDIRLPRSKVLSLSKCTKPTRVSGSFKLTQ